MIDYLARQAISCALSGDWEKALEINQKIIDIENSNIDALNRLAKVYFELGQIQNAVEKAQQVLNIDPLNSIAQRSTTNWKELLEDGFNHNGDGQKNTYSEITFLEEPGKTKIVKLIKLGDAKAFTTINAGCPLSANHSIHKVTIHTQNGSYIGRLPDDIAKRLNQLVEHGNEYQITAKSVSPKEVYIFIRELKKSPKLANIVSFPPDGSNLLIIKI